MGKLHRTAALYIWISNRWIDVKFVLDGFESIHSNPFERSPRINHATIKAESKTDCDLVSL